jgi:hypothetical protein
MMALREYVKDVCEELDASIYSGQESQRIEWLESVK